VGRWEDTRCFGRGCCYRACALFSLGHRMTQRRFVITLLMCSILAPNIPLSGLVKVRPEEFIVLALMPVILIRMRGRCNRIDVCFALIGTSTILSMIWGQLLGIPFAARDLMELVKLVKYWLFFRVAFYRWTKRDVQSIICWMMVAVSIAAFIGIIQWKNWLGVGDFTCVLYSRTGKHILSTRIVGTMNNGNNFALLMFTGLAFIVGAFQWCRQKWMIVIVGGLCLFAILLTTSRSGILGTGLVLFVTVTLSVMWLRRVSWRRWFRWMMIILLAMTIMGGFAIPWLVGEFRSLGRMSIVDKLEYRQKGPVQRMIFRFDMLLEANDVGARRERWERNWKIFQESPVLGWGPGKSEQETVVDNEYLLYMRRYGVVGLLTLFLFYGQIFCFCRKLLHIYPYRSTMRTVGLAIMATLLAYLAVSMFTIVFYQIQLMSLFCLLVGLGYSALNFRVDMQRVVTQNDH
jgi:O-antigen ligase